MRPLTAASEPSRVEIVPVRPDHRSFFSPRLRDLALVLLLACVLAPAARAEEPLWGEIASTLGKGFLNVTTRGALIESKPYRHHGGPVSLTIDRTDVVASVEYGLLSNLDLHVRVPYFDETIKESVGGQSVTNPLSGLGEVEMGAKWRFWQSITDRHKDELALLADLKLPTGATDLRDRSGGLITPHLQPNSGNLGGMLGLAANRHTGQGGYWFSVMMDAEAGSTRVRRPNMLEIHASMGRRAHRLARPDQTDWMGIIGLHFHLMGRESELGRTLRDSGGTVLSAELGLVGSKRNRGARLGILFPLHTDLGLSHAPPRREIQGSFRASF